MKKRWSIFAAVLCLTISAVGCNQTKPGEDGKKNANANETKTEENEKQSNLDVLQPTAYGNVHGLTLEAGSSISIIGRGKSSAYWSEVEAGAQRAVDDINAMLGYKGSDKVKLTYSAPETENDVDDQVNILDEELARYPVAVGIAAVDSSACEVQFDLAAENGIPIVAFDSGTDYQNIVSMVDTNNNAAAITAANKLCDSIDDQGEILMIVHDTRSTSAKEREQSFVSTIQESHPGVQIVQIYHMDELEEMQKVIAEEQNADASEEGSSDEDTAAKADLEDAGSDITQEDVIKYILEKHPNIKGIYTTNETAAVLATDVLDELKKTNMKVVSFDGGEDQMKLLEDGKIEGLIVQNPYGIGYATVVACARAVLEQGNEARVDAGYTWVTKDNMKEKSIQKMLY